MTNGSGYKNPPEHGRFQPGQSGNRAGRPKGSRNKATILKEIAGEEHSVTIEGKKVKMNTLKLLFMRLREMAMQGDDKALDAFNDWNAKLEQEAESTWDFGLLAPEQRYRFDTPLIIEDVEDDDGLTCAPPQAPMDFT